MFGWNQRMLDTRAIELASGAQSRVDRHEDECAERYKEIARQLERVFSTIESSRAEIQATRKEREESSGRIYAMLWKGMGFLVVLLLTIIGYLLDKGGLPLQHLLK